MQRRQALDQIAHEVGCRGTAIATTGIPHGDLVDLDVLDRLGLQRDNFLDLLGHKEGGTGASVATTAFNQALVTLGLGIEHLPDTLGLGFVLGQDGVSYTLGFLTGLLRLGSRSDLNLLTIDLFAHNFRSIKPFFLSLGLSLLDGYLGLTVGHFTTLRGLGTYYSQRRVCVSNLGLGLVLTGDRVRFFFLHKNTFVSLRRL